MDHMEFSIALPSNTLTTNAGHEWASMKERLAAHLRLSRGNSLPERGTTTTGSTLPSPSFLAHVAGQQIVEVTKECEMTVKEASRFMHALYLLEDRCVPFLLILYNRFRFFTCRQGQTSANVDECEQPAGVSHHPVSTSSVGPINQASHNYDFPCGPTSSSSFCCDGLAENSYSFSPETLGNYGDLPNASHVAPCFTNLHEPCSASSVYKVTDTNSLDGCSFPSDAGHLDNTPRPTGPHLYNTPRPTGPHFYNSPRHTSPHLYNTPLHTSPQYLNNTPRPTSPHLCNTPYPSTFPPYKTPRSTSPEYLNNTPYPTSPHLYNNPCPTSPQYPNNTPLPTSPHLCNTPAFASGNTKSKKLPCGPVPNCRLNHNSRRSAYQNFDTFLGQLQMWTENCEFGDLQDILLKDCIITGIQDNAARHCLLRTEGLDLNKTLHICRAVERIRRVKDVGVETDKESRPMLDASTMAECTVQASTVDMLTSPNIYRDRNEAWLGEVSSNSSKIAENAFLPSNERLPLHRKRLRFSPRAGDGVDLSKGTVDSFHNHNRLVAHVLHEIPSDLPEETSLVNLDEEEERLSSLVASMSQSGGVSNHDTKDAAVGTDDGIGVETCTKEVGVNTSEHMVQNNSKKTRDISVGIDTIFDTGVTLKDVGVDTHDLMHISSKGMPSASISPGENKTATKSCEMVFQTKLSSSGDAQNVSMHFFGLEYRGRSHWSGHLKPGTGISVSDAQVPTEYRPGMGKGDDTDIQETGSYRVPKGCGRNSDISECAHILPTTPRVDESERQGHRTQRVAKQTLTSTYSPAEFDILSTATGGSFGGCSSINERLATQHCDNEPDRQLAHNININEQSRVDTQDEDNRNSPKGLGLGQVFPVLDEIDTSQDSVLSKDEIKSSSLYRRERSLTRMRATRKEQAANVGKRETRADSPEQLNGRDQNGEILKDARPRKVETCDQLLEDTMASEVKEGPVQLLDKKYTCTLCSAQFYNLSQVRVHLREHNGERPFVCLTCGATFVKKSKLRDHQRKHTGERPYTCSTCGKTFAWSAAYSRHLRVHTGERPYTCEYCGMCFSNSSGLNRHVLLHTGEKPYSCRVCQSSFSDATGLRQHQQSAQHANATSSSVNDMRAGEGPWKERLKLDIGHNLERPYVCHTCGATFRRSSHLQEHSRLHTGERPHTCEVCGARFSEASKLKAHRRRHTGERPYVCKVCGAAFSWTAALTRHTRTHTLEKPYKCPTCGKTFADHSTLTKHCRTHTGERPFPCTQCRQAFADSSSLRRHLRTHSGEKFYTCEVCGAGFSVKGYLTRHMRIHSGDKPHGCAVCGARFIDASKLKRHSKVHLKPTRKEMEGECKEEPSCP